MIKQGTVHDQTGYDQKPVRHPARLKVRQITSASGWQMTLRDEGDMVNLCNKQGDVVFSFPSHEKSNFVEAVASFCGKIQMVREN